MTVQVVANTGSRGALVRGRGRPSGENDFALYLAGLMHRPGSMRFTAGKELSGRDDCRQMPGGDEVNTAASLNSGRGCPAAGSGEEGACRAGGPEQGENGEGQGRAVTKYSQGEKTPAAAQETAKAVAGSMTPSEVEAVAGMVQAAGGSRPGNGIPAGLEVPAGGANPLSRVQAGDLLPVLKSDGPGDAAAGPAALAGAGATGKENAADTSGGDGMGLTIVAAGVPAAGKEGKLLKDAKLEALPRRKDTGGDILPRGMVEGQQVRFKEDEVQAGGSRGGNHAGHGTFNLAGGDAGRSPAGEPGGTGTAGGPEIAVNERVRAGQGSHLFNFPANGGQAGGTGLPVGNLTDVVAATMAAARMSRSGRQQEIEIRLQPESLGNMKLRAILEGGRLVLHLLVENNEAARALRAAVPEMRLAVAQQGLHLDQVQVQVGGEGPGSGFQAGEGGSYGRDLPGWRRGTPGGAGQEAREIIPLSTYRLDYLA